MVNNPAPDGIDLETFLKTAGQSFTDAQRSLTPNLDVSVNMMLSNAELELRAAVSSDAQGKMSIRLISSEDIIRGGIDPGLLSTIRINYVGSIGEIKARPPVVPPDTTVKGSSVPNLIGLVLDNAVIQLKSGGWQFEPHAASKEEITAAGKDNRGRVIRQQPPGGQSADKTKTVIQIWVDLGNVAVREVEGIGVKYENGLTKSGVATMGELSLASIPKIASTLRISETRAKDLVDIAGLMTRLAILGFKDQVTELIVKGANIRSIEQLSDTDPKDLFAACRKAIDSGKVKVPRGFKFTVDDVSSWIKSAVTYSGK